MAGSLIVLTYISVKGLPALSLNICSNACRVYGPKSGVVASEERVVASTSGYCCNDVDDATLDSGESTVDVDAERLVWDTARRPAIAA